ncbi:MAG: endonuclease/exonuclease/phosphatase family protein [Elusimicrobiaceae bacterium]
MTRIGRPERKRLPRSLRVTVWNNHKCRHGDWERDFLLLREKSDIMLMQEILLTPAVEAMLFKSGLRWDIATSFFTLRTGHAAGIATGSLAIPEKVFFRAETAEPIVKTPKMLLGAVYAMPGVKTGVMVINIHGINFTGTRVFARQMESAARALADFPGPVIAGGDFNSWSKKRKTLMYSIARETGLTEVPFHPDCRSRHLRHPVDHIFTRGFRLVSSAARGEIESSDHKPICATLELDTE